MIVIKYNAFYKGLMFTLRPAVAPTTQVFVQELSRLDSAFAPDSMLIISAMLAGFKSENNILPFQKEKKNSPLCLTQHSF
jgi:hypothetical protein